MTKIFNQSLSMGIFPNRLKYATIIPIFKSGNRHEIKNYRPISLLSNFSKIFEKIINKRLQTFLLKYRKLSSSQFGFRKNHSCSLALADLILTIQDNLNNKKVCSCIFLDLKKAFDTLDHKILLNKLKEVGIGSNLLNWFSSYLSDRINYSYVNGIYSDPCLIKTGVPQGSILGPTLFNLYINDLPQILQSKTLLFADDTTILISSDNNDNLQTKINSELSLLVDWLSKNKLYLNLSKTKCMFFNKRYNTPITEINNVLIEKVDTFKLLGVNLDSSFKFSNYLSNLTLKLSKLVPIMFKIRNKLPLKSKKMIYYSLVQSNLLYCSHIMCLANKSSIQKAEKIQHKIISILFGNNQIQLINFSNLIKFECNKFLVNVHNSDQSFPSCFSFINKNYVPRSVRLSFNYNLPHFTYKHKSLLSETFKNWNSLPNNIKKLKSNRKIIFALKNFYHNY